MKITENLSYTKGEKIAESFALAEVLLGNAAVVVCMAAGLIEGFAVLFIVISIVMYGILTCCSVYPHATNIVTKPELYTEHQFHVIRHGCIVGKMIFAAVLLVCAFLPV